jgi:hypothetical protein
MSAFILTSHAETVIAERAIRREWLARVLATPTQLTPDRHDAQLRHALGPIAERSGRVLRVIFNDKVTPVRVVTAYFDRSMRNKL